MEGKKNTKKKCRWSKDDTELTLMALPIAFDYPFFQNYFISELTVGAVKG